MMTLLESGFTSKEHEDYKAIIEESIVIFGTNAQLDQAVEEASEFIQAVMKFKRYVNSGSVNPEKMELLIDNLKEERVDLSIMLKDVDMIFSIRPEEYADIARKKMAKLKKYINEKTKEI